MPRYSVYKDSDYQWIGNIPEKWNVQKLSSCLFPVSEKNRPSLPLLSITRELGVIERDIEDQDTNHNFIPDDLTNYKLLKKGQFGMNKMKAWQGSYGISNYTGIVSPAYFVFDLTKNIETEFFNWAIRSSLYVSYFGSASDGVRIGQWDLSKTRMKSIPFLIPSKNEQITIVNFLDQKIAQIDQAIAIKQKQIERLKERQQIIIQQAVTKGLDPNVPMKDSGIEWIGMIPEHWKISKLKYLLDEINIRTATGSEELLSLSKYQGVIPKSSLAERAGYAESLVGYKIVKKGCLVINKMQAVNGLLAVSNFNGITSPDYSVYKEKNSNIININFLCHLLLCPEFLAEFKKRVTGVMDGFIRLYTDDLYSISIFFPEKEEQSTIVDYIEQKMKKYNNLIDIETQQIEKLKEYKTTLIDSAVTGKIKITPEE